MQCTRNAVNCCSQSKSQSLKMYYLYKDSCSHFNPTYILLILRLRNGIMEQWCRRRDLIKPRTDRHQTHFAGRRHTLVKDPSHKNKMYTYIFIRPGARGRRRVSATTNKIVFNEFLVWIIENNLERKHVLHSMRALINVSNASAIRATKTLLGETYRSLMDGEWKKE